MLEQRQRASAARCIQRSLARPMMWRLRRPAIRDSMRAGAERSWRGRASIYDQAQFITDMLLIAEFYGALRSSLGGTARHVQRGWAGPVFFNSLTVVWLRDPHCPPPRHLLHACGRDDRHGDKLWLPSCLDENVDPAQLFPRPTPGLHAHQTSGHRSERHTTVRLE